ncbi:MAG: hypothetical protein IIC64_18115 [SAR324 cluster bacterium]|nr:hypothetical protein [SAR324 cluster bacterium]
MAWATANRQGVTPPEIGDLFPAMFAMADAAKRVFVWVSLKFHDTMPTLFLSWKTPTDSTNVSAGIWDIPRSFQA